ncbi:MAG: TetR/AcrR family transcriptional regulator, partial [Fibrobacteria bacterium]
MTAIDRRIQKTKKILSEALIALILEKGYEKVTIKDIIDKANVGRSTFYSHYESKDQLLLAGPQNLGVRIFGDGGPNPMGAGKNQALDFLPLFRHAAENLALSKAMIGRKSGEIFNGHLQSHLSGEIRERFQGRFGKSRQDKLWLRYFSTAAAGTVMGFLISWLEDDVVVPAEEMAG